VASIATNTTDDIGGEIALLRAVVLAVSDLTTCDIVRIHGKEETMLRELTVLASLVLIVAESTVEGGQFTKLVTLEFVLTLGDRCGLSNN
jgi:hypothetical protein